MSSLSSRRTEYGDALLKRWAELAAGGGEERDHEEQADAAAGGRQQDDNGERGREETYLTSWLARDLNVGKCSFCGSAVEESFFEKHKRNDFSSRCIPFFIADIADGEPDPMAMKCGACGVTAKEFPLGRHQCDPHLPGSHGCVSAICNDPTVEGHCSGCTMHTTWQQFSDSKHSHHCARALDSSGAERIFIADTESQNLVTATNVWKWSALWEVHSAFSFGGIGMRTDGMANDFSNSAIYPSSQAVPFGQSFAALVQTTGGLGNILYSQKDVWAFRGNDYEAEKNNWLQRSKPRPLLRLPPTGLNPRLYVNAGLPESVRQHGGANCDVWTRSCPELAPGIKHVLDAFAAQTNDRPIPRYQMIIDPNLFTRRRMSDQKRVWVPSEFDVSKEGKVKLVGGPRAHWLKTELIDATATPVLEKAVPLLARLRRPALLLEDQRLQVVVKAQRIEVPEERLGKDSSEYHGLLHVDGANESVVAVVLFYYSVDESLRGGDMEFIDRRPMGTVWDDPEREESQRQALKQMLHPIDRSDGGYVGYHFFLGEVPLPNCKVPIGTGTMLVFSNYQMAHRVLKMINTSKTQPASRDFVALFVLDPAADPLVPAQSHLARSYLYERCLMGPMVRDDLRLIREPSRLILEFMGIAEPLKHREQQRLHLLKSQLQPSGHIRGCSDRVYSTGNGCATMIGWVQSMLEEQLCGNDNIKECFPETDKRLRALNVPPSQLGRGISETLSIETDELSRTLDLEEYRYRTAEERDNYSDSS